MVKFKKNVMKEVIMSERGLVDRERVSASIIPDDPRVNLDEFQAAKILGKSVHWMRRARWAGNGPEFVRIGGNVRYRMWTLEEFIDRGTRRSTSDTGQAA